METSSRIGLPRGDHVARIVLPADDQAVEGHGDQRFAQLGPVKCQRLFRRDELLPGLEDGGLGAGDARFGRGRRFDRLVQIAAADRVVGHQALAAVAFPLRLLGNRDRGLLVGLQPLDGGLDVATPASAISACRFNSSSSSLTSGWPAFTRSP